MYIKILIFLISIISMGCIPQILKPDTPTDIKENVDIVYTILPRDVEETSFIYVYLSGEKNIKKVYSYDKTSVIIDLKWNKGEKAIYFIERNRKGRYSYELTKLLDIDTGEIQDIYLVDPFNISNLNNINKDRKALFNIEKNKKYFVDEEYTSDDQFCPLLREFKLIEGKRWAIIYGWSGKLKLYNKNKHRFVSQIDYVLLNFGWDISPDEKKIAFTSYKDKTIFKKLRVKTDEDRGGETTLTEYNYQYTPPRSIYIYDIEDNTVKYLTDGEDPHFWEDNTKILYSEYNKKKKKLFIKACKLKMGYNEYIYKKNGDEPLEIKENYKPVGEIGCIYYISYTILEVPCLNEFDVKTGKNRTVKCMVQLWDVRASK